MYCEGVMVRKIKPDPDKTVFNAGEACWYVGYCWNHLKRLIGEGVIHAERSGRRYTITKDTLDLYLKRKKIADEFFVKELR
jgi:excisionase family DNA binding protein